jgi:hypothetical protein
MYYQRFDVKRTIVDFANSSVGNGFRECAIYDNNAESIQRHVGENGGRHLVSFSSGAEFEKATTTGASAFYCSYWHYDGLDFSHPVGRDLVWTIRAKKGGLEFAKVVTSLAIRALEEAGVSEPWVKYSGDLGFDIVVPLEGVPLEAWMGDLRALDELQIELTNCIVEHLREHAPNFDTGFGQPVAIKRGMDTCLLSELRVRRGLLLAPMSLNPETGLVSVPVDPDRVSSFSVLDASPENVQRAGWAPPTEVAYGLLRHARTWQAATSAPAVVSEA